MGILDEAIREHLELKRQQGAGDSELKKLEDEAFGPPARPGVEETPEEFAEAPTEFMAQPEAGPEQEAAQEESAAGEEQPEVEAKAPARREPAAEIGALQEAPPPPTEEEEEVEEPPAIEHEAIPPSPEQSAREEAEPEPQQEEPSRGASIEEREAVAEQPTELYDVEGEIADSEVPAPPQEQPVEEEEEEEEDDFFDEKRLSDELDQALEPPIERGQEELEPKSEGVEEEPREEALEPRRHDEDLLDETPEFLEEAPEDDQLWFEQKPPKDFDFDD